MTRLGSARAAGGTALALVVALVCAACAPAQLTGPQSTVTASPEASRGAVPPPPEDVVPEIAWPLTGVDAEGVKETSLERPALAIKIENSEAAHPQSNLDRADVVYEEYVEGGVPRFIAVYHSDWPETVGPIRSMRPMDWNIVGSLKGPIVFSGAQGRFITQAANTGVKLIAQDVGSGGFFRTNDKPAPHNLHGTVAEFGKQAAGLPAPAPQWAWAYPADTATAAVQGTPVSVIDITMSGYAQPEWTWSPAKGVFTRSEKGVAHKTKEGVHLSATNVITLWVTIQYTSGSGRSSVPETLVNNQSGSGFLATAGKYVPITWSKKGQFDPFVYTTEAGETVTLAPGKTWIELVPNKGVTAGSISFK